MIGRGIFGSEPNTIGVPSTGPATTLPRAYVRPGPVPTERKSQTYRGRSGCAPAHRRSLARMCRRSAGRRARPRIALAERLEEQDGARDGGVQRADRALHRDADEQVATAPDGGAKAMALAAHHDRRRSAEVRLAGTQRRL